MPLNHLGNLLLGAQTDDGFGHFAVLEEQKGRNSANRKPTRHFGILVHVHLANDGASVELGGQRIDARRQHAAWATPRCPEIDQHHPMLGVLVEVAVRHDRDLLAGHIVPLAMGLDTSGGRARLPAPPIRPVRLIECLRSLRMPAAV